MGKRTSRWIFESARPVGNTKRLSKQGSSPPEKQRGIVQGETSRCSEEIPFGQTLVFVGSKIWIEKDSLLNGQDDQVEPRKELPGLIDTQRTRHRTGFRDRALCS